MDFTVTATSTFPVGTEVGAYPGSSMKAGRSPTADVVASAVATAAGVLFEDLEADTAYVAYALVEGEHRYVRFATPPEAFNPELVWRGEWSSGVGYIVGDAVGFEGSSYVAEEEIAAGGSGPDVDEGWGVLAEKGDAGDDGAPGENGVSTHVMTVPGLQVVHTGTTPLPIPVASTLLGVTVEAAAAPTGASLIVDVNLNGSTIFTTQANRPSIAAGASPPSSGEKTPDVTAAPAGSRLTVDVDQIGSTLPGEDVTVAIRYVED